jgi:diadenosine tetraphosphatase ApaH/serine/threonine PP2A family protein phosphatase
MPLHSEDTRGQAGARIALVSDVHGNAPAFRAVLDDVGRAGADDIWCLGDLVGYGAEPDACVELAREACSVCLAGNHDLVVTGEIDIDDFSSGAATAALWTRENIAEASLAYLRELTPLAPDLTPALYHGSPRDPVWEYVLSDVQAEACFEQMEGRVGAIGHSHVALHFRDDSAEGAIGEAAPDGTELDISQGRWLINPGGVGQPRDGDPRAAWLLLDTGSWTASWRRVEYPIDEAAAAIERAGLPAMLAERLYVGQ